MNENKKLKSLSKIDDVIIDEEERHIVENAVISGFYALSAHETNMLHRIIERLHNALNK